jgi:hypothetical protein
VVDYNLAAGESRRMMQPRIDTGSWTQKGRIKHGQKFSILQEYFVSAVRETQNWGKFCFIAMTPMSLHACFS